MKRVELPGPVAGNSAGHGFDVFVSNVLGGTVTRIDLKVSSNQVMVRRMVQIASGYQHRTDPAALVLGPGGLAYDAAHDTLYVTSMADDPVFAIAKATRTTKDMGTGRRRHQSVAGSTRSPPESLSRQALWAPGREQPRRAARHHGGRGSEQPCRPGRTSRERPLPSRPARGDRGKCESDCALRVWRCGRWHRISSGCLARAGRRGRRSGRRVPVLALAWDRPATGHIPTSRLQSGSRNHLVFAGGCGRPRARSDRRRWTPLPWSAGPAGRTPPSKTCP
jgi:hypothetical protein